MSASVHAKETRRQAAKRAASSLVRTVEKLRARAEWDADWQEIAFYDNLLRDAKRVTENFTARDRRRGRR